MCKTFCLLMSVAISTATWSNIVHSQPRKPPPVVPVPVPAGQCVYAGKQYSAGAWFCVAKEWHARILENGTLFARVDAANRLQMEPEVCPGPTIPQ
jgi:hypothetical protein